MRLIYTSHRVEYIPLFAQQLKNCNALALEEPETVELKKLLSKSMDIEEYVKWVDTTFPTYTFHFAKFLLKISDKLKIYPIEPYLQIIEGIHNSVEEGKYEEYIKKPEVKKVLNVERKATAALLEYQEAFMRKDFDMMVENTLKFAKADAERFVLRDKMRSKKLLSVESNTLAVEAGQIHFLLEHELSNETKVESVNLIELASKKIGIKYIKNPGNELTEIYIKDIIGFNEKSDLDLELLAAQALVYITIVKKEEMLPDSNEFPHLIDEVKCAKFARSLSYNKCKKFVESVWFKR